MNLIKSLKNFFFAFLITFIVFILFILSTEFLLRKIGLGNPIIYDRNLIYGYSLKPEQKVKRFQGANIIVNSIGLRNSDEILNQKDNLLLFLGDSVTYGGSKIDNEELFTNLICKKIEDSFCGNAGINSYGILNTVLRSRYDQRLEKFNTIVFTVIEANFDHGLQRSNLAHYYMSESLTPFRAIEEAINYIGAVYDINRFLSKRNNEEKIDKDELLASVEFAIKNLNEEIERLKKKNKKVYVFYSPSIYEINNNLDDIKILKIDFIKKNVLNLIDLTADLKKYDTKELFFDDIHLKKRGHEIYSQIIGKYLE